MVLITLAARDRTAWHSLQWELFRKICCIH